MAGSGGGAPIYIDVSYLMETIQKMKNAMLPSSFQEMMRRTFNDAGKKVKTIIRQEVPKEYAVTASWAGSAVGWPQMQGLGVIIPIKGARGSIGGTFSVLGGRGRPRKGRRAKITAKILKGGASTLPNTLPHQGGNPPFMNGKMAFTRTTRQAYPIARVVGLGVPQMPINRSKAGVEKEIKTVVEKRLLNHFSLLFR